MKDICSDFVCVVQEGASKYIFFELIQIAKFQKLKFSRKWSPVPKIIEFPGSKINEFHSKDPIFVLVS